MAALRLLDRVYTKPPHALAFAGIQTIYKYFGGDLSLEKIKDFLSAVDVYTLHRETKRPQQYNPTYVHYPRQLIQLDLATFDQMEKYNHGYKWIQLGIDCFTKRVFYQLLPNKNASTVLNGFKLMHADMMQMGPRIQKVVCDAGKEWDNAIFRQYCKSKDIAFYLPKSTSHATTVERVIRTIKSLIGKYCTRYETKTFVDVLPDIISTYNNRYHRMIKASPMEVENSQAKQDEVRRLNAERYAKIKARKPTYQVGQLVRIEKAENQFRRSYQKHFTDELFKIHAVHTHMPIPMYTLATLDEREVIDGHFSSRELVAVKLTRTLHIKKVLKKEADKILVNFKSLPDNFRVWIMKNQVYG